jgi:methionine aminotransferase
MLFEGELTNKLPHSKPSIFSKMSGMAREHNAVNLSQGFPNFNPDKRLIKAVHKAMKDGLNQYAPMAGLPILREKIAEKTENTYGLSYHPDREITIFPGATLAIFATIQALIKEGDEVLLIDPAYDCYAPAVELAGGIAVHSKLTYPDFKIDWEDVRKRINIRTKMILINSPHNPTGAVLLQQDLNQLKKMVSNTDILVLSDEVYEHIVFDDLNHLPVASDKELAHRTISISSFGKTYHTTGWKMGYILAPENITQRIRNAYQFMAFSAHTPTQAGLAEILNFPELYQELSSFYEEKRDTFRKFIDASRFKILPCQGSYFQLLDYSGITDQEDVKYAELLVREHGVAAIPTSVFYKDKTDHRVLRFCFAKSDDVLEQAAEMLCKI